MVHLQRNDEYVFGCVIKIYLRFIYMYVQIALNIKAKAIISSENLRVEVPFSCSTV